MKNFSVLILLALILVQCQPDDPQPINEEELITTFAYALTPIQGGSVVTLAFFDYDGNGGTDPVITGGNLQANTQYQGRLDLYNESQDTTIVITDEIMEEADDHQFFFQPIDLDLEVFYADEDQNNHPVGLLTTLQTGDSGIGSLKITLRHQPDKSAEGVKDGDLSNAGGETDIEVNFPIEVQ